MLQVILKNLFFLVSLYNICLPSYDLQRVGVLVYDLTYSIYCCVHRKGVVGGPRRFKPPGARPATSQVTLRIILYRLVH